MGIAVFEVITRWQTAGSSGGVSVMYFDESAPIETARTALFTLWGAVDAYLTPQTNWSIDQTGRIMDPVTGTLTGDWFDSTVKQGDGGGSGAAVANSTMILLQWTTGQVLNGRRVRGRTFVPGMVSTNLASGELSTSAQFDLVEAADGFATAGAGFGVWHRPGSGPGAHIVASAGSCWKELAVQRGRRS